MNVKTYNQKGKEIGQTKLPEEIFEVKENHDLMHQVVVSQMANRRQGTAHTKERGDVQGGGRKPWAQKGTGRARHGSIRSPIWKGGGVTFGPRKEKVYSKTIPKKIRRAALLMVLSGKVKNNLLVLVDELKIEKPKTRQIVEILKNLHCENQKSLIAIPEMNKDIVRAAKNIQKTRVMEARELNALDLLNSKYLIMPKDSIKKIKDIFIKDKA